VGFVSQGVIRQRQAVCPETVRLHHVSAGFEIRVVHFGNRLRSRDRQIVIAAEVLLPAEIIRRQILQLEHGAHRAVENQNPLVELPEISILFGQYLFCHLTAFKKHL